MITLNLLLVALLIVLTAFFVISEFSIVKVRRSKIESRVKEDDKKAESVLYLLDHLDDYLSACQLGITITSLGLGWLGEPTVDKLLHPIIEQFPIPEALSHTVSFAIAFFIITFLHVVLGELAPKTIAIQKAEAVTLIVAKPLIWFHKIMFPFIWLLNGSANILTRMLGFASANESDEVHSEDELRHILSESYEQGEITQTEYKYVDRIFEFDNRTAREIMVPRTEVVVVDINDSMKDNMEIMRDERYTRYPVINEDKDDIVGVIHMKELFYDDCDESSDILSYVRPVPKIFENVPLRDLLLKMQKDHIHLAVLVDEYGGTSGIVTVEDILEEIVGEIRDEFDYEEELPMDTLENGHKLLDGKMSIQDVNDYFDLDLEHDEVNTISGWMLTQNINAEEGTEIDVSGYRLKVKDMEDSHIQKIELWKIERE
ncbi:MULTISPECIES: hemolysin family protein [Pontibacillus]|uniref:Hemolysin family protein n=1 Tax=Pontibacillus chungwhensis TaxID=265426 RepID=A0ABY8V5D6_9BACI|nr:MULTISPECIES: hemolysin family protein [Pontibacillus]MCD5322505.1 hemolysin family protein [Pontibacillus sp. HN14]WIF99790.1 hemolysin family protein [Pontibacillus chungwhensis]